MYRICGHAHECVSKWPTCVACLASSPSRDPTLALAREASNPSGKGRLGACGLAACRSPCVWRAHDRSGRRAVLRPRSALLAIDMEVIKEIAKTEH